MVVSKLILEKQKYKVETRLRCDNIIKDIKEVQPCVVLMDLWIPDIGGEKAINLMRKNEAARHSCYCFFS